MIEMSFKLTEKTKVLLNGKEAKLADLKDGDQVDVDYETSDDVQKVSATPARDDCIFAPSPRYSGERVGERGLTRCSESCATCRIAFLPLSPALSPEYRGEGGAISRSH